MPEDTKPPIYMFPNLTYSLGPWEDRHAYITNCNFDEDGGFTVPCQHAQPMLTDAGLCWAINSDSMEEIYTKSIHLDKVRSYLADYSSSSVSGDVFAIPGHGKSQSFRLSMTIQGIE